jgi:hypothetical protein
MHGPRLILFIIKKSVGALSPGLWCLFFLALWLK